MAQNNQSWDGSKGASATARHRSPAGMRWVASTAADYPERLRGIPDGPRGIWLRSALCRSDLIASVWDRPAVAIVGTRGASAAGLEISRTIAWGLARAGILVVSGLARGVDAAAHEGALLADGSTVAVLACGLDQCYPSEHTSMAEEITCSGALLSEWPSGTPPVGWRFPRRNRLISGLADIVVLVEANVRSGALHTVRFAIDQGREVMAVPRDPVFPGSVLPNRLIRDGAAPVMGCDDVLYAIERLPGPSRGRKAPVDFVLPGDRVAAAVSQPESARREPLGRARRAGTGDLRSRLLAQLGRSGPLGVDDLVGRSPATEPSAVMAELVALEVEARIRRDSSGRFRLHGGS